MANVPTIREMTEEEARICANRIRNNYESAAAAFAEFTQREGWRALKYSSLEACVVREFPFSASTFYRHAEAMRLKQDVGLPADADVPVKTLEQLKALPIPERKAVWDKAREVSGRDVPPTALVKQVVQAAATPTEPDPPAPSFPDASNAVPVRRDVPREPGEDEPDDEPDAPSPEQVAAEDRAWLAGLPAWPKLHESRRPGFARDALAWRRTRKAVDRFHSELKPILAEAHRGAHRLALPWAHRMAFFFRWRGPHEWQACGTCNGTGRRVLLGDEGDCSDCKSAGYQVK